MPARIRSSPTAIACSSWPTDVFVTPSGLEVYRSISPQKPDDYIALRQSGRAANRRQRRAAVGEQARRRDAARQRRDRRCREASRERRAAGDRPGRRHRAGQLHRRASSAGQRALDQFKAASDQARAATSQTTQQFTGGAEQTQQQAADDGTSSGASRPTAPYSATSSRPATPTASSAIRRRRLDQNVQQQAQQFGQELRGTSGQTRRYASQPCLAAGSKRSRNGRAAALRPPRPATPPPPSSPAAATAPGVCCRSRTASACRRQSRSPQRRRCLPTENPWMAAPAARGELSRQLLPNATRSPPASELRPADSYRRPLRAGCGASPAEAAAATSPYAPPTAPQVAATPPPTRRRPQPPVERPQQRRLPGQLVPASQAPPIAMDGFCPVTLLETVARDPHDRTAWKKGNRQVRRNSPRPHVPVHVAPSSSRNSSPTPTCYAPVLSGCDPVALPNGANWSMASGPTA